MKIILGIDPGSRVTGYGVIWTKGSESGFVACGELKIQSNSISEKLHQIYSGIKTIIEQYQPHCAAIEEVFMHENANSALKLGQARGAALVAAAAMGLPISEYNPRQIKQALTGYGAADKNQMQRMVTMLLKLTEKPKADAADALAIALCHSHSLGLAEKLQKIC